MYCSIWIKNSLGGGGLGWVGRGLQGCQQRHNRCTHSPSDTLCSLSTFLFYFSQMLSFCLFRTQTHVPAHVSKVNKQSETGEGEWLHVINNLQLFVACYQGVLLPGGPLTQSGQPCQASPTIALTVSPWHSAQHINQTDSVCLAVLLVWTHLHLLLADFPQLRFCSPRHATKINIFHPGWSGVSIKERRHLQRVTLKFICGYWVGERIKAFFKEAQQGTKHHL